MMVTMAERDLRVPSAIGLSLHGISGWVPIVEAADDVNGFGIRRHANEIGRQGEFFSRIAVAPAR